MKVGDKVFMVPRTCPAAELERLNAQFVKKGSDREYKPSANEKTEPDEGVIEGVLESEQGTQYYVRVFLDKDKGSLVGRLRLVDADRLQAA